MKKPILFVFIVSVGVFVSRAAPHAFDDLLFGLADHRPATERPTTEKADNGGPQAICRQIEVEIDEGYGVSGRETRVVCQDGP
jgi:hypothetical protein